VITHKSEDDSAEEAHGVGRVPGFAASEAFAFPLVVLPTFFLYKSGKDIRDIKFNLHLH
jgi:hypothetical protein